jgi:hypothetical protein
MLLGVNLFHRIGGGVNTVLTVIILQESLVGVTDNLELREQVNRDNRFSVTQTRTIGARFPDSGVDTDATALHARGRLA